MVQLKPDKKNNTTLLISPKNKLNFSLFGQKCLPPFQMQQMAKEELLFKLDLAG